MKKESFLEIKRQGFPYPTLYVDGMKVKVDHIDGDDFILSNGTRHDYQVVMKRFYSQYLPESIYNAIKNDLLEMYQFGNKTLEQATQEIGEKYSLNPQSVVIINNQLVIADLIKYKEQNG